MPQPGIVDATLPVGIGNAKLSHAILKFPISGFTDEQIIGILKEHEAGTLVSELCRKHGISDATFYNWKAKYGGMEVSEAKRLKALEEENARLKNEPRRVCRRLQLLSRMEHHEQDEQQIFT